MMKVLRLAVKHRRLLQLRKAFLVHGFSMLLFWFGMAEESKTAFFDSAGFLGDDGECLPLVEFL